MSAAHTPGPWRRWDASSYAEILSPTGSPSAPLAMVAKAEDANLIAAAPELLAALHEGRRAIGDHNAPDDCYATGPMTGDPIRDLVQCPACSFIVMHDAAIARATGAP